MKHLWIVTLCAASALALSHSVTASELTDEKEMEMEESTAEVIGSVQNTVALTKALRQEKFNVGVADKAVQNALAARTQAEKRIGTLESRIHTLRVEQKLATARQRVVHTQRVLAQRQLAVMIQQMRAYQAQLKKTQKRTENEQRVTKAVKGKMARIQKRLHPDI